HTIDVNSGATRNFERSSGLLVRDRNSGLSFDGRQIPIEALFEARFIEHHRMQRLGERTYAVESGLRHIADFAEILIEFRIGISPGRPSEHSAQGREYLPELVVQLTGDVAQGGFLCRDQLLCQVAPLLGESRQPAKEFAVRAD